MKSGRRELKSLGLDNSTNYANIDRINMELEYSKEIMRKNRLSSNRCILQGNRGDSRHNYRAFKRKLRRQGLRLEVLV